MLDSVLPDIPTDSSQGFSADVKMCLTVHTLCQYYKIPFTSLKLLSISQIRHVKWDMATYTWSTSGLRMLGIQGTTRFPPMHHFGNSRNTQFTMIAYKTLTKYFCSFR